MTDWQLGIGQDEDESLGPRYRFQREEAICRLAAAAPALLASSALEHASWAEESPARRRHVP